jgi:hypothetical protein
MSGQKWNQENFVLLRILLAFANFSGNKMSLADIRVSMITTPDGEAFFLSGFLEVFFLAIDIIQS